MGCVWGRTEEKLSSGSSSDSSDMAEFPSVALLFLLSMTELKKHIVLQFSDGFYLE